MPSNLIRVISTDADDFHAPKVQRKTGSIQRPIESNFDAAVLRWDPTCLILTEVIHQHAGCLDSRFKELCPNCLGSEFGQFLIGTTRAIRVCMSRTHQVHSGVADQQIPHFCQLHPCIQVEHSAARSKGNIERCFI